MRYEKRKTPAKGSARGRRAPLTGDGIAAYCPKRAPREFGPRFASRIARPLLGASLLRPR